MKILNVACGKQTYGTHFIDLYPQRKNVIKCDVEHQKLPFSNGFFDEVYSENLFEHLKNPNKVLREMYRVLKKNGKLVVITDNASFWGWHVPTAKTHYGGYEEHSFGSEDKHFGLYTSWHLENHFKSLNLKDIKIEYLLIKEKNRYFVVRLISKFLSIFYKRIAYPAIKITGVK